MGTFSTMKVVATFVGLSFVGCFVADGKRTRSNKTKIDGKCYRDADCAGDLVCRDDYSLKRPACKSPLVSENTGKCVVDSDCLSPKCDDDDHKCKIPDGLCNINDDCAYDLVCLERKCTDMKDLCSSYDK